MSADVGALEPLPPHARHVADREPLRQVGQFTLLLASGLAPRPIPPEWWEACEEAGVGAYAVIDCPCGHALLAVRRGEAMVCGGRDPDWPEVEPVLRGCGRVYVYAWGLHSAGGPKA